MNASWQEEWFRTDENKLNEIKPTIQKWKFSSFRERWKEVIFSRLRIGNTRITHRYLIEKTKPPIQLTVKHIIGESFIMMEREEESLKVQAALKR